MQEQFIVGLVIYKSVIIMESDLLTHASLDNMYIYMYMFSCNI